MKPNKERVGLITYHAAYNFGSVLQAYATQKTIEDMGYEVEVIDYRTNSQVLWYTQDVSIKKGWRNLLHAPEFWAIKKHRVTRIAKFEKFINGKMNLTSKRFTRFEDFKGVEYDILVSGSDQVWNIGCGEFRYEPFDAIRPYFLDFGNPRKRIAYASSFGPASVLVVKPFVQYLKQYDAISTREPIVKRYLCQYCNTEAELVCDPTWLLDKSDWCKLIPSDIEIPSEPYLLIYNLPWRRRTSKHWLSAIKNYADKRGLKTYCISPLNPLKYDGITMIDDAGPIDFIALVKNASFVVTNTFHGTIFSMNFEIPFASCQANPGSRQAQMLELCGIEDRIVNSPSEFSLLQDSVNFDHSTKQILQLRKASREYLNNAFI